MPLKPSIADVHHFLRANDALIVHFSGVPKGVSSGFEQAYPHDLRNVIAGGAQGGLACSIVTPNDVFVGNRRHAFGCVGVILDLITPGSLAAVSHHDVGSSVIDGKRIFPDRDITPKDLQESLDLRGEEHNEWGLRDYKVIGILAIDPYEVCSTPSTDDIGNTTPEEIRMEFPGQRVVLRAFGTWWLSDAPGSLYP